MELIELEMLDGRWMFSQLLLKWAAPETPAFHLMFFALCSQYMELLRLTTPKKVFPTPSLSSWVGVLSSTIYQLFWFFFHFKNVRKT